VIPDAGTDPVPLVQQIPYDPTTDETGSACHSNSATVWYWRHLNLHIVFPGPDQVSRQNWKHTKE
jgi:hypothetical protein